MNNHFLIKYLGYFAANIEPCRLIVIKPVFEKKILKKAGEVLIIYKHFNLNRNENFQLYPCT